MKNELGMDKITIDPNTGQRFVYVGAGKSDANPEAIIAYSPSDMNGRAVAFADGSVQVLSAERFQEALARDAALARAPGQPMRRRFSPNLRGQLIWLHPRHKPPPSRRHNLPGLLSPPPIPPLGNCTCGLRGGPSVLAAGVAAVGGICKYHRRPGRLCRLLGGGLCRGWSQINCPLRFGLNRRRIGLARRAGNAASRASAS